MKNKFLIIGSGAAAVGVVYGLRDKYPMCSIKIITSETLNNSIFGDAAQTNLFVPEKLNKGRKMHVYTSSSNKVKIYDTSNHSMTRFWGAGMYVSNEFSVSNNLKNWEMARDSLVAKIPIMGADDSLNKIGLQYNKEWPCKPFFSSRNVESDKTNFHLGMARIAIDDNCIYCAKCMSGCNENAIWNSLSELKKIPDVSFENGTILKVKKNLIYLKNGENHIIEDSCKYSKVFLCTGVVGTSKIILNSIHETKSISFSDNPVYTFPAFTTKKINSGISLANYFTVMDRNNTHQLASIYPFFPEIWDTRFFKFISKIKFLKNFLEQHLVIVRCYSSARNPVIIKMKLCKNGKPIVSAQPWKLLQEDKKIFRQFRRFAATSALYIFPFGIKSLNSAHYYRGTLAEGSKSKVVKSFKDSNIIIADAWVVNKMPAISPTFSIMLHAYCKANEVT